MKKLSIALTKAAELEAEFTGKPVSAEFRRKMRLLGAGIFRVVVLGEINKGKSSFINAMLGYRNLLPTGSSVTTSAIFKIRYGRELAYKVYFSEVSGKPALAISAEQLAGYGTEDGNPGNEKQVDFIEVCCPSPILKSGVVIIDTPGLGGTFRDHKKITYRYVPKADAVFFVTDSMDSPIGAMEIEYLKDIGAITKHICFVQTKISAADSESCEVLRENNLNILQSNLGMQPTGTSYFLLDSEIRYMAEEAWDTSLLQLSGYPELLSFVIKKLLPAKRRILAENAVSDMSPVMLHLAEQVAEKERFLQADTEDKRNKARQEIQVAMDALEEWNKKERNKLLHDISAALDKNRNNVMDLLVECRPNGEIQAQMEAKLNGAKTKEELLEAVAELDRVLPEYASRCTQTAAAELQKIMERLLQEQLPAESCGITPFSPPLPGAVNNAGMRHLLDGVRYSDNAPAKFKSHVYGDIAGEAIAAIAGGIVGSIIPVVGNIIGSSLGAAIAGFLCSREVYKKQQNKEMRELRDEAYKTLTATMSAMYGKMVDQLNEDIKSAVEDKISCVLQQKSADMRAAVADLRQRAKMDSETLEQRRQELETLKRQLAAVKRIIAEYLSGGMERRLSI